MSKKQLDLFTNRGHGGKRSGAGRPRKDKTLQLHLARPNFQSKHPLHVNVKLVKGISTLRNKKKFKMIKQAILKARQKGLAIIHFSIQTTHIHLMIESENKKKLGIGMQSFCTSLAKNINSKLKRRGKVFRDRYHLHILKTPTEVRNTLVYIFQNWAKHSKYPNRFDSFSTLICFPDKRKLGLSKVNTNEIFDGQESRNEFKEKMLRILSPPTSWLVTCGWKRAPSMVKMI